MKREFTASVYIFHEEKVLLIQHRKLKKWLPAGGHIEEDETPEVAARREAKEETGLDIEFIKQENCEINAWNAKSIVRPYLCLLEEIPECKGMKAHQHIDFVFIAKPQNPEQISYSLERVYDEESRWFSLDEINNLQPDVDIFEETKQVITHIFNSGFVTTARAIA